MNPAASLEEVDTLSDDSFAENSDLSHYQSRYYQIINRNLKRDDMNIGTNDHTLPRFFYVDEKLKALAVYLYGSAKAVGKAHDAIFEFSNKHLRATPLREKTFSNLFRVFSPVSISIWGSGDVFAFNDFPDKDILSSRKLTDRALKLARSPSADERDAIFNNGTPIELALAVEADWPFMRKIHMAGEFSNQVCYLLQQAASIRDRLASKEPLQGVERNCLLLAAQYTISRLPHMLYILAGIYFPGLNKAVDFEYTFAGFTHSDVTEDFDIWSEANEELDETLESIRLHRIINGGLADLYQEYGRGLISAHHTPMSIYQFIHRQIEDKLHPFRDHLSSLIALGGAADTCMLSPAYEMPDAGLTSNISTIAGVDRLVLLTQRLIDHLHGSFDHNAMVEAMESRTSAINEAQDRIEALNASRSIESLLEIASLADNVKNLIVTNQEWYQGHVDSFNAYYNGAIAILKDIQALNESCSARTQPVTSPAICPAPSENEVSSALRIADLEARLRITEDRLSTALADVEHLDGELQEKKSEVHKLRTAVPALPAAAAQQAPTLAGDPELINRVVLRSNLSATDVLDYFATIAPDRVCILTSAYDSAASHAGNRASIERMLDLLHKAAFPYLDAINSGTPDTEARKIFGTSSYSAKESQTTLSNNRLGALRDFVYQGKTIRFERHLRIHNGTGKDGMRLYFEIIDGKLVIPYAGPHLDVVSS